MDKLLLALIYAATIALLAAPLVITALGILGR
jgi:hypothetical protein